jgi:hypothetical protein
VPQVAAQIRSIFQGIFFGENSSTLSQKDYLKPINISIYQDNINSMTLPHSGTMSMTEALKKHINGLVPVKQ